MDKNMKTQGSLSKKCFPSRENKNTPDRKQSQKTMGLPGRKISPKLKPHFCKWYV